MKITLLGTGTSVGIPSLGQLGWGKCNPKNPKNLRQRCSVLIQSNDTNILIDAGPDIKNQLINHNLDGLNAIIITHEHADHISGLDELRPFYFPKQEKINYNSINCFTNVKTTEFLKNSKLKGTQIYLCFPTRVKYNSKRVITLNFVKEVLHYYLFQLLRVKNRLVYGIELSIDVNVCGTTISLFINTKNENLLKLSSGKSTTSVQYANLSLIIRPIVSIAP